VKVEDTDYPKEPEEARKGKEEGESPGNGERGERPTGNRREREYVRYRVSSSATRASSVEKNRSNLIKRIKRLER